MKKVFFAFSVVLICVMSFMLIHSTKAIHPNLTATCSVNSPLWTPKTHAKAKVTWGTALELGVGKFPMNIRLDLVSMRESLMNHRTKKVGLYTTRVRNAVLIGEMCSPQERPGGTGTRMRAVLSLTRIHTIVVIGHSVRTLNPSLSE